MDIVFARENRQLVGPDTLRYIVKEGEVWAASDPLVRANPDAFSETPVRIGHTVPIVEQATAAPGERRRVG